MSRPWRLTEYTASEFQDQCALVRALDRFKPHDMHFHHIPNQQLGGVERGVFLKNMGRKRGAADLYFLRNGRTLFLEMKTPKGVQSEAQEEFRESVVRGGAMYEITRSLDEAHAILRDLKFMDRDLLRTA